MKKMQKRLALALIGMLMLGALAGCGQSGSGEGEGGQDEEMIKIGVVQLLEHAALDASYQGFVDGLKEAGFEEGKNIVIDFNNAQGEQANCQTIAHKLVNDQSDLILAIATTAAQAVANVTQDIPVLFTAVTDPVDAKLVADYDAPGGNVTGSSDLTPVKEQIALIKQIVPDVESIGMLYSSSEANSVFQINLAKAAAEELGIASVDASISNSNEIQQVTQSLVGKVQAIYIPTDNMLAAGMSTVTLVTEPAKIPVIVGEEGMVNQGGLATYGINYYNLGKLTATQAVQILKDGVAPADIPVAYLTDLNFSLNEEMAQTLGIEIPEELLAQVK